jgi:hypothetical protein
MSLTLVTKYKKEGKLFTQFSLRDPGEEKTLVIREEIAKKYPTNESFDIVREGAVTNFSMEFPIDDSLESEAFINTIYAIIEPNT